MAVFYNQATLSYSGGTINSNVATGEIAEAVSVTKTAVSDSYAPDGSVTYVVSITNSGTEAAAGLTLSDDMGAIVDQEKETIYPLAYEAGSLLYLVAGVPSPAPAVTAGPPLQITGVSVPAQSSVTLIYQASVTSQAPLGVGSQITNTVTVTGDCIPTPLTDSATVAMAMEPRLAIAKSVDPAVVTGCSELTYTFLVQNYGGAAGPEAAVTITDTFDPVLQDVSVNVDGVPMARSAYSYDESTGALSIGDGQLTVPGAAYARSAGGAWAATPGQLVVTVTGTL